MPLGPEEPIEFVAYPYAGEELQIILTRMMAAINKLIERENLRQTAEGKADTSRITWK